MEAPRQAALLEKYLQDALRILAVNLQLAEEAEPACYRAAAGQLRLLLCDTTRIHGKVVDISLAGRVCPNLHLPALAAEGMAGAGGMGSGLARLEWLAQPYHLQDGQVMTVGSIIRRACDRDGGVHVDLRGGAEPDFRAAILVIGRAALAALKEDCPAGPVNS